MSEVSGANIGLKVNDADVTLSGTLNGSDSQDYYNWCTLTATISLNEGENAIVFYVKDATNASFNLDYIKIGDTTYEAEDAVLYTNPAVEEDSSLYMEYDNTANYTTMVETEVTSASGSSSVGNLNYDGNSVTFTINSDAAVDGVTLTVVQHLPT